MMALVLRRLAAMPFIFFGAALLVFLAVQLIPGDPAQLMLGEKATPEALAAVRAQLGLDQPVWKQLLLYLNRLLHFDLGTSIQSGRSVASELGERFPATLELTLSAMFLATAVGVPLGVVAAVKKNRWPDLLASGAALGGLSIPVFWLGLLLMMAFSAHFHILPFGQRTDLMNLTPPITGLVVLDAMLAFDGWALRDGLVHLILPAVTLATVPMATLARMARAAMLEVLGSDYVRTARAKGLAEGVVRWHHAFRNAALPVVTVAGLQLGALLAGAVLTETMFAWPGMGSFAVQAISTRDIPALQGCALLFALTFVLANLAADMACAHLDPRLREEPK